MAKWTDAEIIFDNVQVENLKLALAQLDLIMYRGDDRAHPLDGVDWQMLVSTRALLTRALNE